MKILTESLHHGIKLTIFFYLFLGPGQHQGPGSSEPVSLLPNGVSYYQGGGGGGASNNPPVQMAHSTTAHEPPHSVTVTQGIPQASLVASVAGQPPGLPLGLARLPSSPAASSAATAMALAVAQQKGDMD